MDMHADLDLVRRAREVPAVSARNSGCACQPRSALGHEQSPEAAGWDDALLVRFQKKVHKHYVIQSHNNNCHMVPQ
jgi:hypothetical protein